MKPQSRSSKQPPEDPTDLPTRIQGAAVKVCQRDPVRLELMLAQLLATYRACAQPGCKGCEAVMRTAQSVERELETLRPGARVVPDTVLDGVATDVRR